MSETVFRRHHHPQPLRKTDRRWLERIAAGGVITRDVPATVVERLQAKNAISLYWPQGTNSGPAQWAITPRGRAKLQEEP